MAKKLYMIYFVCIPFGFVSGLPKPAFCLGMEGLGEALVLLQDLISNEEWAHAWVFVDKQDRVEKLQKLAYMFLISQFMPGFVQARCLHMPEALETAWSHQNFHPHFLYSFVAQWAASAPPPVNATVFSFLHGPPTIYAGKHDEHKHKQSISFCCSRLIQTLCWSEVLF